jgi:hypothetical protein
MADEERAQILAFPQARVRPPGVTSARQLGISPLVRQLGLAPRRLSGHWCSRCQGIWHGLLLEAECPACGNRQG